MMKKASKTGVDNEQPRYKKILLNNQQKSPSSHSQAALKTQKLAEYRSQDKQQNSQQGESIISNQNQKSRTRLQRSDKTKINKEITNISSARSDKQGRVRANSKQKKDRLAVNIAKFTRKTNNEKPNPTIKENNKDIKEKIQSVYVEREQKHDQNQIQPKVKVKFNQVTSKQQTQKQFQKRQYIGANRGEPIPNQIKGTHQSYFTDQFDSVIQQGNNRSENSLQSRTFQRNEKTSVKLIQSKITPQPYHQKNKNNKYQNEQIQLPKANNNSLLNSNHQFFSSPNIIDRNSRLIESSHNLPYGSNISGDKSSFDLLRGQQHGLIEQLAMKMKADKEQFDHIVTKIQKEKNQLQEANRHLIQSQFGMKNQIQLLKVRNVQLIKDLQNVKSSNNAEGFQREKMINGTERALADYEARFNKASNELRAKVQQNATLSFTIKQFQNRCSQLESKINSLESSRAALSRQLQRQIKIHESEVHQIRNNYEFRLKQIQLKNKEPKAEEELMKITYKQLQKQLIKLRNESFSKEKRIKQLLNNESSEKANNLQLELQAKQNEVQNLLKELNFNQQNYVKLNKLYNETIKKNQIQFRTKQKELFELKQQLDELKKQHLNNNYQKSAYQQMYSNHDKNNQATAFVQLQQKQTNELNYLRDQIINKNKECHNIQIINQELKEKIRKLEQENQMGGRTLTSNFNNLKQAKDASEMVLKAEVDSLKKKLASFQIRMNCKDQEIKSKNKFIEQHLRNGLNNREDASLLISRLEQALNK